MATAVDTNVLLDIFIPGAPHGDRSEIALVEGLTEGAVVLAEAVYAELAAHFTDRGELDSVIHDTGMRLEPSNPQALHASGLTWREYLRQRTTSLICPSCGSVQDQVCTQCGSALRIRQHVAADFLIGAHALSTAGRLLTRDRGYYRTYFPDLLLI